MPALNRPISERLFGANKTWRGALMMNAGTVAGVGMLLGIANWAGELPNSFFKRRLGIPPGEQRRSPSGVAISLFDQADWVPVASVLLRPVWRMSGRDLIQVAALVTLIHIPINVIGYLIGARTAPI